MVFYEVKACLGCNACRNGKHCIAEEGPATLINYIGFRDKGMLLAGGCGDTNGKPQIGKTDYLRQAYEFGKKIY